MNTNNNNNSDKINDLKFILSQRGEQEYQEKVEAASILWESQREQRASWAAAAARMTASEEANPNHWYDEEDEDDQDQDDQDQDDQEEDPEYQEDDEEDPDADQYNDETFSGMELCHLPCDIFYRDQNATDVDEVADEESEYDEVLLARKRQKLFDENIHHLRLHL